MDERVRRHARLLVEHCTAVEPGDAVFVSAPTPAEELVVAIHEILGEHGATPHVRWRNPRASRAYLRAADPETVPTPRHERAAMAESDVAILIKTTRNAAETADVPPAAGAAASRAREPVLEERLDAR